LESLGAEVYELFKATHFPNAAPAAVQKNNEKLISRLSKEMPKSYQDNGRCFQTLFEIGLLLNNFNN
jgi:hypothetical protein